MNMQALPLRAVVGARSNRRTKYERTLYNGMTDDGIGFRLQPGLSPQSKNKKTNKKTEPMKIIKNLKFVALAAAALAATLQFQTSITQATTRANEVTKRRGPRPRSRPTNRPPVRHPALESINRGVGAWPRDNLGLTRVD